MSEQPVDQPIETEVSVIVEAVVTHAVPCVPECTVCNPVQSEG